MSFAKNLLTRMAKKILNYTLDDLDRDMKLRYSSPQTKAGVNVNEYTAMRHITVASCIRVRSETFASLPVSIYRKRSDGKGRDEAWDHPLYEICHAVPNPEMPSFTWRETQNMHLDISGNCYSVITTNRRGQITELYPWPWYDVDVKRNETTKKIEYHLRDDVGIIEIYPAEKIFHVPGFGYNGTKGVSVIRLAAEAVGTGMALSEFTARFFGQGMNMGGMLETDQVMKQEAVDLLRTQFTERGSGLANSWLPIVLHSGLKYSRIPMPLEDVQALELMRLNIDQICGLYRIPPHMIGEMERSTYCLPSDAEIYTASGPKRIADICPGELVWSRQENGGILLSRVEHAGISGIDSIIKVSTTNRTIRLNAKHKVLARRAKKRDLLPGELGGGNRNGKKYRIDCWATEYVPAGELRIGDTIITFNGTPDTSNWVTPTRTATVGFMEFCGLYLGAGYMNKRCITIARAKNALYMDYYRGIMRQEFKRLKHSNGGNGQGDRSHIPRVPVTLQEGDRCTRFSSVETVAELREIGLGGTAHTKNVPGWIFGMAKEAKLAFLRGFLDAAGSVDKKGRIAFHSCNRKLLSGIRHLCMSLSIPVTNTREIMKETRFPNGKTFPMHMYSFTCSNPEANQLIGSHDSRYIERLEKGKPFGKKGRSYPQYGGRGFSEPGVELSRIVSIEKEDKEPVYDLTVAGTHSFIADGVVVHNSNIEFQGISYVVNSILPLVTRFEQIMNWKLFTPEERRQGYYVKYNVDGLMRGDYKSRQEGLSTMRQNGVISTNDWRELEEMNPRPEPGADALLVNGNMISVDTAVGQTRKTDTEGK